MHSSPDEIIISFIALTFVLGILVSFIVSFAFLFQRRQFQFRQERKEMQEQFQRELLLSQLEIQNQTLQQIAEELHDHVGQLLTVALMRLNALEEDVIEPGVLESVQQTRDLVSTIMADVRTLSKTLDYDTVRRFGLLPSLTLELDRIQRMGRVRTELITTGKPYSLGEQTETVLLRMAQESLNNALKHARARQLTVTTDYQTTGFSLTVADDGRGFDVGDAINRTLDEAGAGLGNLQRRATLLGGTCSIESYPNAGTRVQIHLPYSQVGGFTTASA